MKKILVLFLAFTILLPINAIAKDYSVKDLSISVDDTAWDVFTRDNIKDNSRLEELGITYDYVNNFMNNNDVYLDACQFDMDDPSNTLELFVIVKKIHTNKNLHAYSDKQIKEVGEAFKKKINADNYDIYKVGKYIYVHSKTFDASTSYNLDEYYTVINGYGYTIMAQKANNFTNEESALVKSIVDTTKYKYIASYDKKASNNDILIDAIIGAIGGAIVGIISAVYNKKKKKELTK